MKAMSTGIIVVIRMMSAKLFSEQDKFLILHFRAKFI